MKFSLKTLAAAVVMAAAATGANADINLGTNGNGELFFNIWDANGSYTRGLSTLIGTPTATQISAGYTSFEGILATAGNIDLTWTADATLNAWLATADVASLKWNVVANDTQGANRLLTTYKAPEAETTKLNNVIFSASTATTTFVNSVNLAMPNVVGASVAVTSANAAWAGKTSFKDTVGGLLNFSNGGTLANNSFASGLGFMRIDAAANNASSSVYNEYLEGSTAVNVWLDASNTLHIGAVAAVPEPESYAMLLAGLGMIGFMAGRRNKRA